MHELTDIIHMNHCLSAKHIIHTKHKLRNGSRLSFFQLFYASRSVSMVQLDTRTVFATTERCFH